MSAFRQGSAPNRFDKWHVERALEVRRVHEGQTRRLEARLRWTGLDPATQLPWADSWVAIDNSMVTPALKAEALALEAVKYGTRWQPSRVTRKTSAQARRPAPAPPPAKVGRWSSVLRSSPAAVTATAAAAAITSAGAQDGSADSGSESDSEESETERMGRRASTAASKRKRGVVVSDSDSSEEGDDSDGATKGEGLPRGGAAPSRWTTWIRWAADAARGVANLRAWWTGGGEETS